MRGHGEQGERIYLLLMCSAETSVSPRSSQHSGESGFQEQGRQCCAMFCFVFTLSNKSKALINILAFNMYK